ncbi:hypothetical protein [Clostridium massiliodielmoense]|uniref:hypothetical protein n=1 Tax=Clostridium massiliodielmoense TaxID=1776385 RepID=UPI000A26EEF4|nr:hypothetical protein [Clostridium massiliodielmoense]
MQRRKIFKKFLSTFITILFIVQLIPIQIAKGLDKDAKLDTTITVLTGTKPFNKKKSYLYPGEDYSDKDSYIRTLDTLKYSLQYTVNSSDEPIDNLTITSTIPLDDKGNKIGTWDSNLKNITGVVIEDNGRKLIYKKKKAISNEAVKIDFPMKVSGNIRNGTKFKVAFNVQGDNIEPYTINTKEVTVSALPKFDLINTHDVNNGRIEALGPNGEKGRLFIYGIGIRTNASKGSEALNGKVSFCDDLNEFGIKNATLYTWGHKNEDHIKSCGINGDDDNTVISTLPYGSLELGFDDNRSVLESGKIIAKQESPGKDINITIKNMDSSVNHYPTKDILGNPIDRESKYVFSGYIVLWVNENDISLGENQITNRFNQFNVKSISGALNNNDGNENLDNNTTSFTYIKREEGKPGCAFDVSYIKSIDEVEKLHSMNTWWSGDGVVIPNQVFAIYGRCMNNGTKDLKDLTFIQKIDPKVLEITDTHNNKGKAHSFIEYSNVDKDDFEVEYGTGNYKNWEDQHNDTGEKGNWFKNTIEAKESSTGPIVKVRAKLKKGRVFKRDGSFALNINVKAKNGEVGTISPVTATTQCSEINNGEYVLGNYKPETHENIGQGDRVKLSKAIVRIENTANKEVIKPNEDVKFNLKWSFTTNRKIGDSKVKDEIVVKSILPKELSYKRGTSSIENKSIEPTTKKNEDGSTILTWTIKNSEINIDRGDITYEAKSNLTFDRENIESKAVIYSPMDVSSEEKRTSTIGLTTLNMAMWKIDQETLEKEIEKNKDINYVLSYFQTYNKEYNNVDIIDVLPFNGDNRGTKYSGECFLKSIKSNVGEEIYISYDDPKTINKNPKENKSNWIPYEENIIKGSKVTAVKIHCKVLSTEETARKVLITLGTKDNTKDDIYVNSIEGTLDEINKVVKSSNIFTKVYEKENIKENETSISQKDKHNLQKEKPKELHNENNNEVYKIRLDKSKKSSAKEDANERKNLIDNNISNGKISESIDQNKYVDKSVIKETIKVISNKICDNQDKNNKKLPITATNYYNHLLSGIVMLIGVIGLIIYKRKRNKK